MSEIKVIVTFVVLTELAVLAYLVHHYGPMSM